MKITPRTTDRRSIHIHIERLVLDGLPVAPGERPALQAAVEAELTRLVTAGGLTPSLQAGGIVPRIVGGGMPIAAQDPPTHLGRKIARSVYRGLGDA